MGGRILRSAILMSTAIGVVACAGPPRNVVHDGIDCSDPEQATRRPLVHVSPYYPPRAFQEGITGWVDVHLTIGTEGEVTDARVLRAQPTGVFENEVLRTVRQWRYCPPSDAVTYPEGIDTRLRFQL